MWDASISILAVEPPPPPRANQQPFLSFEFWLAVGLLIAVLLIGAVVLSFMDRWRKKQLLASQDPAEALTSFRTLYEQGELSEEEYQRVRDRVAMKMKESNALPQVQSDIVVDTPILSPSEDGKSNPSEDGKLNEDN